MNTNKSIHYDILLPILENEYYNTFEQKNKLESKTIGYITIISIILSVSIAILIITVTGKNILIQSLLLKLMLLDEIGVIYFCICALISASFALYPRRIHYFKKESLIEESVKEKEIFDGSLIKTYYNYINRNKSTIYLIALYNEITYIFLIITISFYVIQMVILVISLIKGAIYG